MKLRLSVLMAVLAAAVVSSLPLQAADAAVAGKWTAQVALDLLQLAGERGLRRDRRRDAAGLLGREAPEGEGDEVIPR